MDTVVVLCASDSESNLDSDCEIIEVIKNPSRFSQDTHLEQAHSEAIEIVDDSIEVIDTIDAIEVTDLTETIDLSVDITPKKKKKRIDYSDNLEDCVEIIVDTSDIPVRQRCEHVSSHAKRLHFNFFEEYIPTGTYSPNVSWVSPSLSELRKRYIGRTPKPLKAVTQSSTFVVSSSRNDFRAAESKSFRAILSDLTQHIEDPSRIIQACDIAAGAGVLFPARVFCESIVLGLPKSKLRNTNLIASELTCSPNKAVEITRRRRSRAVERRR